LKNLYDICIIGSGPAGLFAADKLSREGYKVGIIEKTPYCSGGLINDGKLNLSTKIGMDLEKLGLDVEEAEAYISYVDNMLLGFGADPKIYGTDVKEIETWTDRASRYGIQLISARQRHIGTDKSKELIKEFRNHLSNSGVEFHLNTDIKNIKKEDLFILESDEGEFQSKYLLASPGRSGAYWFREQARNLGVETKFGPIDVGVRIEMLNEIYQEITDVIYDPKFIYENPFRGGRIRTFCTNPGGRVRMENMESNGETLKLINGDGLKGNKTKNTNMAILVTNNLTEPMVDTTEFGREIALRTLMLGGGKPLVQRVGDFLAGKRSHKETFNEGIYKRLESKLEKKGIVTPGDIGRAYDMRIGSDIEVFLRVMDRIFPGFTSNENLLYAPEIKFYDTDYVTTKDLETTVEDLFVAGDGCGKSRGIVGAGMTGIMAAEGIIKKNG